ncbi:MAG: metal-dependent transcriptional regulator [Anaerolineales bacterium]
MNELRATGFSLSETAENYLKAIYQLRRPGEKVSTSALAQHFCVAPASATGMLKKLARERPALVDYAPRYGVSLTELGENVALEVVRHHRLLESYLHEALGYSWDEVHAEAERLEHVISEQFEDRIAKHLGEPSFDPHGHPIPTRAGECADAPGDCLSGLEVGHSGRVTRVAADDNPAMLRYLAELGIVPNARITVTAKAPFGGPLQVQVDDAEESHALGARVTDSVYILIDS